MIQFFYNAAPNPMKVALLLEELGLSYEAMPVDTRRGEQHSPEFLKVNPNAKVPAIRDGDVCVFDSNAILLYLADREGRFVPAADQSALRAECLSWLMFVASGVGPFSGQSVHFRHVAPQPQDYALNRYDFEAHRHWTIVEQRLSGRTFMLGDAYSVVDMAVWGWARMLPYVTGLDNVWERYPNVKRLLDTINARPAAKAAEALKGKHAFKADMDDEARKALYPQNERLKR
ncbi:MAG: Disulfide-bond oxidoreductase YfcG [Pseudomonadota bacterium]|jgi:GST-like protein